MLGIQHDDPKACAVRVAFVTHWAEGQGLACPEAEVERLQEQLLLAGADVDPGDWLPALKALACYRWLLRKQPYAFGYQSWSPITAVLEELQINGVAAHIAAQCG